MSVGLSFSGVDGEASALDFLVFFACLAFGSGAESVLLDYLFWPRGFGEVVLSSWVSVPLLVLILIWDDGSNFVSFEILSDADQPFRKTHRGPGRVYSLRYDVTTVNATLMSYPRDAAGGQPTLEA